MAFVFMKARSRVRKRNTKNGELIIARLRDYLDESKSEPIELLSGFWKDEQKALSYQDIRALILSGDINDDLAKQWANDYSYMLSNSFTPYWVDAMKAGSLSQPIMDPISGIFSFDTSTPGIVNWIRDHGAELVTNSTNTQIDGMKFLLGESFRNTYGMDELARLIRPCVGLTRGQASAAEKYYKNIKDTLKSDHPRMSADSIRQKALDAAAKYSEKLHRYRADMIAETEMAYAYNHGADEGIRQAQRDYLIGKVIMRWSTSGDDRVCETCNALEGQVVGLEEHFALSGTRYSDGEYDLPPAHPNCACAVEYEEVDGEVDRQQIYDEDHFAEGEELTRKFYSADTAEQQVSDTNEFLEDFTINPSQWSGNVTVVSDVPYAGRYHRNTGDIELNENAGQKTVIHELLHSRTVYDDTGFIASHRNGILNEASVEYYAEEICKDSGIAYTGTYERHVAKLREIAEICNMEDFDFARSLYNTPYSYRFTKLEKITGNRSKILKLEDESKMRLKELVKSLKGPKSALMKGKPKEIQKTEVITSAQELIDLIDGGWSTEDEFIHIYSVLMNSNLSAEEQKKFIESGRGDEIFESPLVGTIVQDTKVSKDHISSMKKLGATG